MSHFDSFAAAQLKSSLSRSMESFTHPSIKNTDVQLHTSKLITICLCFVAENHCSSQCLYKHTNLLIHITWISNVQKKNFLIRVFLLT